MKYKLILHTKYVFICFLISSLFSCNNSNRETISSIVQYWKQREIIFPANMTFSIQGKDTVDYQLNGDYKILSYVDSMGCTSCKLQLNGWKKIISEVNSLSDSLKFNSYFSLHQRMLMRHVGFLHYMIFNTQFVLIFKIQ